MEKEINKLVANAITKLFQTRDKAVTKQDAQLFRSTQLPEVEYGSVQGYLSIDDLRTEILFIFKDSSLTRVVLVKETYKPKGEAAYSTYVLYFVVNTEKSWFVYKIR